MPLALESTADATYQGKLIGSCFATLKLRTNFCHSHFVRVSSVMAGQESSPSHVSRSIHSSDLLYLRVLSCTAHPPFGTWPDQSLQSLSTQFSRKEQLPWKEKEHLYDL